MVRPTRVLAAALVWIASAIASAAEYAPLTVDVSPVRVSRSVYYVLGDLGPASRANQGFNSNAGFVVTPEGVVVFDALGTPSLGRELLQAIRRVTDQPVRRVIVSHYHADHVYGLRPFKEAGAEVWAHRRGHDYPQSAAAAARLEERRASLAPWVNEATSVVPADRWLENDTSFRLGGLTFRVYAVGPAHTPEDLALLVEEENVLFIGDLMFAGRIPFTGDADTGAWLEAIEKVIGYRPTVLIGGHGEASRSAEADLEFTQEYLVYLRKTMGEAAEALMDFSEAYDRTDWTRYAHLPAFEVANRRNAYNVYLRMQSESLAPGTPRQ